MKYCILALFLLLSTFSSGQTYTSLISEADSLYQAKDYKLSVGKYDVAFKIVKTSPADLYNAACSAALLGDQKKAFKWLNLALENGWSNVQHLKSDSDLNSLHQNEKWNKLVNDMQKVVDLREANYDKPLQAKLIAIFDEDQTIRREYIAAQTQYGRESKQVDSLGDIMMFKDSINLILITQILDTHGWVSPDKVGGQANQTLFLVIQHADLATQQKYLPMMREAVKNKNAGSNSLALLEDRVALGEGKRQLYGSQIGYDEATQKSYVLPLEDPDNVDKHRAEMGLGPIADYVKRWDIKWDVEEYKKQLPALEEKEQ